MSRARGIRTQAVPKGEKPDLTLPPTVKPLLWAALAGGDSETVSLRDKEIDDVVEEVRGRQPIYRFFVSGVPRYGDTAGAEYESEFVYFTKFVGRTDEAGRDKPFKMSRSTGASRSFVMIKGPKRKEEPQPKWCAHLGALRNWGMEPREVDVQVHIGQGGSTGDQFKVVGLADKAVGESRERVRAALNAVGLALPPGSPCL